MDATPTSRSSAMTSTRAVVTLATLGAAAACWVIAVEQMHGMDMGTETDLGTLGFFLAAWVPMMAAMMLPSAVPALAPRAFGAPLFAVSYVAIWTIVGLAVYGLYRPHSEAAAGVLTIAAGLYELTPLKRACRRRCRATVRSGLEFGAYCVGSSIGLMVMLVALGAMSITWMVVVALLVLVQKLLPPRRLVDIPVALAILGLGVTLLAV
jgi:predicted metal-binding membrane protein